MSSCRGNIAELPLNELKGQPGFKIGHLNIRSLLHKIDLLRLDLPNSDFDIFSISETWLTNQTEDKLTTIEGYNFARADRKTECNNGQIKVGGGLGIYSKTNLQINASLFQHLNISNHLIELQWVVISRPHTKDILLGNVYRPPSGSPNDALNEIDKVLSIIPNLDKFELLLMGDFNADYGTKGALLGLIKQFETANNLKQMITLPTRIAKQKKSIIDLAFTNIKYCTGFGVLNYNISDHKPIYILKKKPRNIKKTTIQYGRTYINYSYKKLVESISQLSTEAIFDESDPNNCWEKLYSLIIKVADELCPIVEMRVRENTPEYLTRELIELQHDRDYFVKKAEETCDPGDIFIAGCIKRKARTEIRKAKSSYCQKQIDLHKKDHRKMWKDVKQIDPESKQEVHNLVDETTGIKIDEKKLPEKINSFFVGIGEKLANKFESKQNNLAQGNKITINPNKYDLVPTTEAEVKYRISEISNYKSSGLTNVSIVLMKGAMSLLVKEFTYLYNLVIETGIFPDDWKRATVTPIPKVASPKTCNDLRPISILPLPGKIMEQIVHDQMKYFLEESNYLVDQQYGFRQGKSTTKALARLLDSLLINSDKGDLTIAVFLDF